MSFHLAIGIFVSLTLIVNCDVQPGNSIDDKLVHDFKDISDDKIKKPYQFGYEIEDGQGNLQHRHEESDGDGAKVGSYGYVDANGIYRKVEYIADKNGFRVKMSSNEPGIQGYNSPTVSLVTKPYTPDVTTPVPISSLARNIMNDDHLKSVKHPITKHYDEPVKQHKKQATHDYDNYRKNNDKSYDSDDRPLPPLAPPRPPTPSVSSSAAFRQKLRSRSDSARDAESQYLSAAADWSPRHQDPPNENKIKPSNQWIVDKPHSYSSTKKLSPEERTRSLKKERQYSAYDLSKRRQSTEQREIKPIEKSEQRFYHEPLDKKITKQSKNPAIIRKESEMKWTNHESSDVKNVGKSSIRHHTDDRWTNDAKQHYDSHNHMINKPKQKPKDLGRSKSSRDRNPTQLVAPPTVPRVDYDLPEFPLPVGHFQQSSDSIESTEHKPVHDVSNYSNEQEMSKNKINRENSYSNERDSYQRSAEIGYQNNPSKPIHQMNTVKSSAPQYSPRASSIPNNRREPTRKRPAAYPDKPLTESYETSRNELSSEQPHFITNLIPEVFYENSGSMESYSNEANSRDVEMNNSGQQKKYQDNYRQRDWYNVEGDQANSKEPVLVQHMRSGESREDRPRDMPRTGPMDNLNNYKQIIGLSPREDNVNYDGRSRETLTSSSSSAEAYAAFKTGLRGLFPLINRNEAEPYRVNYPIGNSESQINLFTMNPKRSTYTPSKPLNQLQSSTAATVNISPLYRD
ncbi:uncharacterized protein LOC107360819 [Tetranychus urticae]|uniref:Uncharacterized protein n=1 Tax=Tetranychus urticae TaxID=32264 RepID=T1K502_TETUR|nr:uncharacterized protein LOC107360819 [Tetranychus urticae]